MICVMIMVLSRSNTPAEYRGITFPTRRGAWGGFQEESASSALKQVTSKQGRAPPLKLQIEKGLAFSHAAA